MWPYKWVAGVKTPTSRSYKPMTCITGRAHLVGIMKNSINFRNCHPLLPFRRGVFSEICLWGRWWWFPGCFKISFEARFLGEWRVTFTSFWIALKPPDRKTIESLGLGKINPIRALGSFTACHPHRMLMKEIFSCLDFGNLDFEPFQQSVWVFLSYVWGH